ncbi:fibrinogen C domain-containing protein 1-like [Ruditapes philippinarum]|uniref:fibrinogen C domain-containing protein 1-like n=1 Tax=Ruditapes philippinarum TaxID=129788 RepID=UPI00295A6E85|nr:fibrinogen C domain-containing protein 1-like [Ruditapes philippinarum]
MTMQLFGIVKVLLFSVLVIHLTSSTKEFDRLKSMVKHLENRLNTEGEFRDEDIAEITNRLDGIDKVLNATVGKRQSVPLVTTKASKIDFETVDTLKEDFTRLRTAFTEEKSEAVRFRREIPKIENNLISLNEDVESYCKVAVNNTDQLLTNFETVKHVSEDNLKTSENERKMLQSIAEQVQQNQQNTKQIENIETLITNLYSKMEYLFYPTSCRSLTAMGKAGNGVKQLRQGFEVYCDQTTDGGGWIVFQRRLNGKTDFYRNWAEYKKGFGDLNGEFWLGNEHLSLLTSDGEHDLRIEIEDFEGNSAYAKYSKFKIYPEENNYKLEVSGYSGTAGDSLEYHNGMMFSTYDRDHDTRSTNCAEKHHGAWWYKGCYFSNLNGQYYYQSGKSDTTGIIWFHWKNTRYSLKKVEMKFR